MRPSFRNPIKLSYNMRLPTFFKKEEIGEPKKPFKLPFGDLYFTFVIVVSYLLTRMSYEKNNFIEKNTKELINKTGLNKIFSRNNCPTRIKHS